MNERRQLTIRNVPEHLAIALEAERRSSGKSLNQTVIDLLSDSLGIDSQGTNGIEKFAGVWTEEEYLEFRKNTEDFDRIDPEIWR